MRGSVASCKTIPCANEMEKSSIPYLSEQIVFNILVRLPADILYNSVRYVCRQWYNIIRDPLFKKEHLLRSSSGLFIQYHDLPFTAQFAEMGKMNATVTEVSFPFPNKVLATCDGLVLFGDAQDRLLHVANPLTKQKLTVPPLNGYSHCYSSRFSLAFAHSIGKYKVVCTYYSICFTVFHCATLTLSKDHAWKLITSNNISDPCGGIYGRAPLSIGGFLYWACEGYPSVVALDLESGKIYEFPSIKAVQNTSEVVFYVKKGRSLSCIVQLSPLAMLWDVWVLSDPISGEWTKLYKIDFDVQKRGFSCMFEGLFSRPPEIPYFCPIAWVNNGEVVVFRVFSLGPYIAHNVNTGETCSFGSCDRMDWCYYWNDYAYSLVSLTSN